jgi:prephenate dehydrogenase
VLETAPIKQPVLAWMREYLPPGRHYVGLVPTVSNQILGASERGIDGARADLFRRTVMMIVAPPDTPAEVEQVAINVAGLLGAKPMLIDSVEADGIMTTAHLLPQLAASALLEASVSAAGWREARKVAGLPFAGVTGGAAYYDGPASLEVAALGNRNVVVHGLDVLIAALRGMRDEIEKGDQPNFSERMNHSYQARESWLDERGSAEWLAEGGKPAELPGLGDQVMQMLFGSRIADRAKLKKQGRG